VEASREVDAKLEKISEELHSQRHFTKADVQELVDYAAAQFGATLDARIERLRSEAEALIARRQAEVVRERKRFVVFALVVAGVVVTLMALVAAVVLK
jgi:F0F1-type ATP synthase membrane subunit b/b'